MLHNRVCDKNCVVRCVFVTLQALVRSKERHQKVMNVLLKKEERKRHKLKELGIDYDFPGYVSIARLAVGLQFTKDCFSLGCHFTKETS